MFFQKKCLQLILLTALKPSLEYSRKNFLRLLRLYGGQTLENGYYCTAQTNTMIRNLRSLRSKSKLCTVTEIVAKNTDKHITV